MCFSIFFKTNKAAMMHFFLLQVISLRLCTWILAQMLWLQCLIGDILMTEGQQATRWKRNSWFHLRRHLVEIILSLLLTRISRCQSHSKWQAQLHALCRHPSVKNHSTSGLIVCCSLELNSLLDRFCQCSSMMQLKDFSSGDPLVVSMMQSFRT